MWLHFQMKLVFSPLVRDLDHELLPPLLKEMIAQESMAIIRLILVRIVLEGDWEDIVFLREDFPSFEA